MVLKKHIIIAKEHNSMVDIIIIIFVININFYIYIYIEIMNKCIVLLIFIWSSYKKMSYKYRKKILIIVNLEFYCIVINYWKKDIGIKK